MLYRDRTAVPSQPAYPGGRWRCCGGRINKTTSSAALRTMQSGAAKSSKRSSNTLAEKRAEGGEKGAAHTPRFCVENTNTLVEKCIEGGEYGAAHCR